MKALGRLLTSEKTALWVFVILAATVLIHDLMIRTIWIFWVIPLAIIWFTAFLLAVFNFGFGLKEGEGAQNKVRAAFAVPLALLLAAVLSVSGVGRIVSASLYLIAHESDMRRAQMAAGAGQPAAIPYIEGVPDGGVAIIRTHVQPRQLSVSEQIRLTGERIRKCRPLVRDAFACTFD